MELKGELIKKMETQTFDSGFSKREFVLKTTNGEYSEEIKMELYKDKTTLLDKFELGSKINVSFNIRGKEYDGKYFVNLNAWKIFPAEGELSATNVTEPAGSDDLPF